MMNKKFLKTILTTASSLAIAMCATEAMAMDHAGVSAADLTINASGNASAGGNLANAVITDADTLTFTGAINTTINGAVTLGGLDLGGQDFSAETITVNANATIGAIGNASAGTHYKAVVTDGHALTLSGVAAANNVAANDYSDLGAVKLGSTVGGDANTAVSITATGPVTFTNTFDSFTGTTGNFPTLNVGGAAHIFNGAIGATSKLGAVNITDASHITFGANVTATDIILGHQDSQIILNNATIIADIQNSSAHTGTTKVTITINDATIAGSIGQGGANQDISDLHFATDNKLTIDSTTAARDVYAAITTAMDGHGTVVVNGANAVTFHKPIGTNAPLALRNITINNNSIAVIDSAVGTVYSSVDGAAGNNKGTLRTSGGALTFNNAIGANSTLAEINTSASTDVVTFSGVVNATTIATGAPGVVFDGAVAGALTLGGNATAMNNITGNISIGAHTLTMNGAGTITGNLTNSSGATAGTFAINGADVTLVGDAGATHLVNAADDGTQHLTAINFATDNTLTINGARSIYAPFTTTAMGGNAGSISTAGGNVAIIGDIGLNAAHLKNLTVTDAHTTTVNGNIYTQSITLSNDAANLTIIGGGIAGRNVGVEHYVTGTVQGNNAGVGRGILNVGKGTFDAGDATTAVGNVQFKGIIGGGGNPVHLLNIAGTTVADATTWTPLNTSSAALFAAATFDGANGGIRIGKGATLVVGQPYIPAFNGNPAVNPVAGILTLTNGATIEGAAARQGTAVLVAMNTPEIIGANNRLMSVNLHAFPLNAGAPAALAHRIYADTLDLNHSSAVKIDGNIRDNGGLYTSITSSDFTAGALGAPNHGAYVQFDMARGVNATDLNIGNLGVPMNFSGAGILSIASATPAAVVINGAPVKNDSTITFTGNGTLSIRDGGAIMGVAAMGGIHGTIVNENHGSAAFNAPIAAPNSPITAFNMAGANGHADATTIHFYNGANNPVSGVFAQSAANNNVTIAAHNNVAVQTAAYTATNPIYTVDADKSIIVAPLPGGNGTAQIMGDVVINATYTGMNPNQVVLDLSAMTNNGSNITSITYNINVANGVHPQPNAAIQIIRPPMGHDQHIAPVIMGAGWSRPFGGGVLVYNFTPAAPINNNQNNPPVGGGIAPGPNPFNLPGFNNTNINIAGSNNVNGHLPPPPSSFNIPAGVTQAHITDAASTVSQAFTALNTSFTQGNMKPPAGAFAPGGSFQPNRVSAFGGLTTNVLGGLNSPAGSPLPPGTNAFGVTNVAGVINAPNPNLMVSVLGAFPSPEKRDAFQGLMAQTFYGNIPMPQTYVAAVGASLLADNKIPQVMANAMMAPALTNTPDTLVDQMGKVAAAGQAQEMFQRLNDAPVQAVATVFNTVGGRQAFVNAIPNNFAPPVNFTPPAAGATFATPTAGSGNFGATTNSIGTGNTNIGNGNIANQAPATGFSGNANAPAGPAGGTVNAPVGEGTTGNNPNNQERRPAGTISAPNQNAEEGTGVPAEDFQAVAEGVAAGSGAYDRYGVWGMINGGVAHQKFMKGNPGFKSSSKGATMGVDTMLNDKLSIGFTVSNSMNHVKLKDSSVGSKTDSSSWVGAIYANRQLKHNWFIRGTALFNRTHINDKQLKIVAGGTGIAQSKYNAISYGGDVSVGFAHRFNNGIVATPSVGMRIIHNNKIAYTPQGNTGQNTAMSVNAIDNYSALAGLSVSRDFTKYGINFTPEAHVNMQYGVNTKTPQGTFISPLTPGVSTSFVGTKASKFSSTYGLSLTGSHDRIECGIAGDVTISPKYVGYQGSLKLKVRF